MLVSVYGTVPLIPSAAGTPPSFICTFSEHCCVLKGAGRFALNVLSIPRGWKLCANKVPWHLHGPSTRVGGGSWVGTTFFGTFRSLNWRRKKKLKAIKWKKKCKNTTFHTFFCCHKYKLFSPPNLTIWVLQYIRTYV